MRTIETFHEYWDWINNCYDALQSKDRPLFFRGHADKSWNLSPYVFRNPKYRERDLILDYKQTFVSECDYLPNIERILLEMQHHGIPTRLLDWSISPLAALYFACSSEDNKEKDAEIFALDPWKAYQSIKPLRICPTYNFEIMKQSRLCCALGWTFEEIKQYIDDKFHYDLMSNELLAPLPIVGRYMDDRVKTQQGCFTIWGADKSALDLFPEYKSYMQSTVIPSSRKISLVKDLSRLGINEFTLFSDREGMIDSIRRMNGIFRII